MSEQQHEDEVVLVKTTMIECFESLAELLRRLEPALKDNTLPSEEDTVSLVALAESARQHSIDVLTFAVRVMLKTYGKELSRLNSRVDRPS